MTYYDEELARIFKDLHDAFDIACKKCGSKNIGVDSDVGFSKLSGAWGEVCLRCADCGNKATVWEP
jgi:hypothetical protein